MAKIESPCIGLCSTTLGDDVCRGCRRHCDEIVRWGAMSDLERQLVIQRIERLTVTIVQGYFELFDSDQLESQLQRHRIRYTNRLDPYCWILDLLRIGAGRISNLSAYGIRLTADAQGSLEELYRMINQTLSEETNRLLREKS